jgi:hypothetical protein
MWSKAEKLLRREVKYLRQLIKSNPSINNISLLQAYESRLPPPLWKCFRSDLYIIGSLTLVCFLYDYRKENG